MEFIGLSLIAIIALSVYFVKSSHKAMRDPVKFREYVARKGYHIEQQKDLCKRLGLDYDAVATTTKPNENESPAAAQPNASLETMTSRREKALYNLAEKILEDDIVDLEESKKLRAWFKRYPESKNDRKTTELATAVEFYLRDKVLDNDEALHLFALLTDFCDGFEEREHANQKTSKVSTSKSAKRINEQESSDISFTNELELGTQYFMNYIDSAGKVSDREIVLKKIEKNSNGDTYIKAFCLMRNSIRTFRADRIIGIFSTETGEAFV
ncbi:hypothetical protein [Vibrio cholerae]|uniref:hypothetical protein n=1 Tax=Vibrio cholerae TaxID=666 RepID=UPI00264F3E26|nr:hypothetical protein [Vibrio cholerae]MDN6983465.1 hypothetical protein [Vibrio cholerae]